MWWLEKLQYLFINDKDNNLDSKVSDILAYA